jgi:hypothetical protein
VQVEEIIFTDSTIRCWAFSEPLVRLPVEDVPEVVEPVEEVPLGDPLLEVDESRPVICTS